MTNRFQPLLAAVYLLVPASFVSALANAAIITFSSASIEGNAVILAATTYSTSPSTDSVTIGALGASGDPFSGPGYNFVSPWKTVILSPPATGIADAYEPPSPAVGSHCVAGRHRVTFKSGGSSTTTSIPACVSVPLPPQASINIERTGIGTCGWLVTSLLSHPAYNFIIERKPVLGGSWSQTYSGADTCIPRSGTWIYRAVYTDIFGHRGPNSIYRYTNCEPGDIQ